jgi:hypothetical protein
MVSHIKGCMQIDGVSDLGAEKIIWNEDEEEISSSLEKIMQQ